ncbi:hypothetical protein CHUAL_007242 [Chamberlinius hualienensis]
MLNPFRKVFHIMSTLSHILLHTLSKVVVGQVVGHSVVGKQLGTGIQHGATNWQVGMQVEVVVGPVKSGINVAKVGLG